MVFAYESEVGWLLSHTRISHKHSKQSNHTAICQYKSLCEKKKTPLETRLAHINISISKSSVVKKTWTPYLYRLLGALLLLAKWRQRETIRPLLLVQIEKHFLLEFVLPVIDADRVVMTIQRVDKGLWIERKGQWVLWLRDNEGQNIWAQHNKYYRKRVCLFIRWK